MYGARVAFKHVGNKGALRDCIVAEDFLGSEVRHGWRHSLRASAELASTNPGHHTRTHVCHLNCRLRWLFGGSWRSGRATPR